MTKTKTKEAKEAKTNTAQEVFKEDQRKLRYIKWAELVGEK